MNTKRKKKSFRGKLILFEHLLVLVPRVTGCVLISGFPFFVVACLLYNVSLL